MELFRDRAAAHHLAALQYHWLESALCQIKCRNQPVVSAAKDHYFLSEGHSSVPRPRRGWRRRPRKIIFARRPALPLLQNHLTRKAPRRRHKSASRMRRRSAHVQTLNRRFVIRPTRHRPQKEQLFQRKFALKNVALRQPELPLQVQRRQNLPPDNDLLEVRDVLAQRINNVVAKRFALIVPCSL